MAGGFTFTSQGVTIYKPVLDHMLNAPSGEVGTYLESRGKVIMMAAKRQVGVQTGALKESIRMTHSRNGLGQYIQIGSNNRIAYLHHEGSRPHIIRPRDHQYLRFHSGGRTVYSHLVRHPGTKPNRYLSDNLILVHV